MLSNQIIVFKAMRKPFLLLGALKYNLIRFVTSSVNGTSLCSINQHKKNDVLNSPCCLRRVLVSVAVQMLPAVSHFKRSVYTKAPSFQSYL